MSVPARAEPADVGTQRRAEDDALALPEDSGLGERVAGGDRDAFLEFFRAAGVGLTGSEPPEFADPHRRDRR